MYPWDVSSDVSSDVSTNPRGSDVRIPAVTTFAFDYSPTMWEPGSDLAIFAYAPDQLSVSSLPGLAYNVRIGMGSARLVFTRVGTS